MSASSLAHRIVSALLRDLRNRSGLGDEWDQIDADIQEQLREEWERIVESRL